ETLHDRVAVPGAPHRVAVGLDDPLQHRRMVAGHPEPERRPQIKAHAVEVAVLSVRPVALSQDLLVEIVEWLSARLARHLSGRRVLARGLIEVTMNRQKASHRVKVLGVLSPEFAAWHSSHLSGLSVHPSARDHAPYSSGSVRPRPFAVECSR